jgi:predicted ATPase
MPSRTAARSARAATPGEWPWRYGDFRSAKSAKTAATASCLAVARAVPLAWSYGLLGADEREMLRRLSTFAGDATLDAVEAAWRDAPGARRSLHVVADLAEKNLVVRSEDAAGSRIGMLETVREYARSLERTPAACGCGAPP